LPPTPPRGFPIDGSAGNIQVYADCKNMPSEAMSQAP